MSEKLRGFLDPHCIYRVTQSSVYIGIYPHVCDELSKCTVYAYIYVAAKATYIRLLYGQKGGFSALAP